ncbi:tumor necrosis factor receptor superfamily member 1B [Pogoniulus pusillus]|uniref:tumor necrosis factor receptor superfamily member 1B n=1 Tax=Pogoniulus pusillus TaxID=488313 RepID=UPI0030B96375
MGPRWALVVALLQAAGCREPQFAQCKDLITEFYDERLNKCCSRCPPGEYRTESCSHRVDTKCSPCRPNTYTAVWNQSPQCFACSPPCRKGFVQTQACTKSRDRICSCPRNEYCTLKISENCKLCQVHSKCGKGYRVSRRGTDSTDTECEPCPPGTFSHHESYDTSCVPHTTCNSVAVPGSSISDAVCSDSGTAAATPLPPAILSRLLNQSSASKQPEIITRSVILNSVPEVSRIIGSAAGPLLLVLIIAGLGFCLVSRKKAPVCSPPTTEADLSSSPAEKERDKEVRNTGLQNSSSSAREEQHLLETSASISSSLNNSAGSARVTVVSNGKKATEGFQQQHSTADHCKLHSGDRHSSASSEHSGNRGTQVNVTCIVNVCSPDCSSQFPEQPSSASMDCGNIPYRSPTGEEIPLSKEENLLKNETEIPISVENKDNVLQDLLPAEKKVPQGIQDVKMKTS